MGQNCQVNGTEWMITEKCVRTHAQFGDDVTQKHVLEIPSNIRTMRLRGIINYPR